LGSRDDYILLLFQFRVPARLWDEQLLLLLEFPERPKAFSILSAISGDNAAFSFTSSDKVARRTPSTSAAQPMDRSNSSRISVRMVNPKTRGLPISITHYFLCALCVSAVNL
jgi:hypothetical protein